MYDWPEVGDAVDELWMHIFKVAEHRGLHVPDQLSRPSDLANLWSDPRMILGQVCALNPVRDGAGRAAVLGTIVYDPPPGLPPLAAGDYASVIVCRADDDRRPTADFGLGIGRATPDVHRFAGAPFAANGTDSQSGYWSLGHFIRDEVGAAGPILGPVTITGAHRSSLIAVADGSVDLAAIDVHSWHLALEHEVVAVERLVVIGFTDPTPGAVCVVARELTHHSEVLDAAIATAIDSFVDTPAARRLHIGGYRSRDLEEFQVVADRVAATAQRRWHS
jgi:ABC-type phosphate/phosphonate transport system substrate-binding protein